ncbi:hypothetical protein BDM02DRAFT_3125021 [Thelephora ganbajun]|uniref:Uncharacterized protein n=1 Tax=Thelephora ganbajun TaxID=370292 RepID=A0ACB6YWL6_THEGA|nr:hypothetical protein BDM02DRAFT_3125021 [Thelephora ganbajun]
MREGKLPYQKWFDERDYATLGKNKSSFFLDTEDIELSPAFEDFRTWLQSLQIAFFEGFAFKSIHVGRRRGREYSGGSACEVASFDDETLGGYIHYSSLINPIRRLTGELKGVIIRYDPAQVPLPTSTGAAHPGA